MVGLEFLKHIHTLLLTLCYWHFAETDLTRPLLTCYSPNDPWPNLCCHARLAKCKTFQITLNIAHSNKLDRNIKHNEALKGTLCHTSKIQNWPKQWQSNDQENDFVKKQNKKYRKDDNHNYKYVLHVLLIQVGCYLFLSLFLRFFFTAEVVQNICSTIWLHYWW